MEVNMTDQQIVTLYESSGLSVEEIADSLQMDKEVITLALAGNSAKFNKLAKKDNALFNEKDEERAVMVMRNCLYSEDPNTQFRAAKFMINERKGRHDVLGGIKSLKVNVYTINEQLKKGYQAIAASKEQVIDVQSKEVAMSH